MILHPSAEHLHRMFDRADDRDRAEGQLAYVRYHEMMRRLAEAYAQPLDRVIAVFVSTSPNNDYFGNLRSTVSILQAYRDGLPRETTTISTYKHCRDRAFAYLAGEAPFVSATRGLKILNFYHNLLDPHDARWVTVDGHMVGAWQGLPLTMKEAIVRPREYAVIKQAVIELAHRVGMMPCAVQSTIWFARKRHLRVKYNPQLCMFAGETDSWRTLIPLSDIQPYSRTGGNDGHEIGTASKRDGRAGSSGFAHPIFEGFAATQQHDSIA